MNAVPHPAFADKLAPLNAEREPSLKEAIMELVAASDTLGRYYALPMPEEREVDRLEDREFDARAAAYAAFAKHGIDKALLGKLGGVL